MNLLFVWRRNTFIVPNLLYIQRMIKRFWRVMDESFLRISSVLIIQSYLNFSILSYIIFMFLFCSMKVFFHLNDCLFYLLLLFLTFFQSFVRKLYLLLELLAGLFVNQLLIAETLASSFQTFFTLSLLSQIKAWKISLVFTFRTLFCLCLTYRFSFIYIR